MARYSIVNSNAKRQRKRKIKFKIAATLFVILAVAITLSVWIYWRSMTPTILDIAQIKLQSATTLAVNEAVCIALADCNNFSEFINIERNNQNDIVMISANSSLVNNLARNTAIVSQNKINSLKSFDVNIPLGTLSGVPLLSEKGPSVNVVVSPIGSVNCTFSSEFISAGINQTLHQIYINVQSRVDLIMPTSHMEVETVTPILICESVIIGKIPDTFLQGGLLLGSA